MAVIGIVCEYNPFHTGHAWQIRKSREMLGGDAPVVCVMSGNWTQQAECAIADKWTRAHLALLGGADLVLELPTLWAVSSAESFARGAVSLLLDTGAVDTLSFGSECGDIGALQRAADTLDSPRYPAALRSHLYERLPFATARQRAVEDLAGRQTASLLRQPNNNLGVEYLRALRTLDSGIRAVTVKRTGAGHGESDPAAADLPGEAENRFLSATAIRQLLRDGDWDEAEPCLPAGGRELLEDALPSPDALEHLRWSMLARVRTMTAEEWAALPDSGAAEGLPERLAQCGRNCRDLEEFFLLAKTKRYTRARLARLVLWAWLNLTAEEVPEKPPYLRVLGCNERGREILRGMKQTARLPVVTRPAQARSLDPDALRVFQLESGCTDRYGLCFEPARPGGAEWYTSAVVL